MKGLFPRLTWTTILVLLIFTVLCTIGIRHRLGILTQCNSQYQRRDTSSLSHEKNSDSSSSSSIPQFERKSQEFFNISMFEYLHPGRGAPNGYLVYDCSKRWPGACGGLSDRFSGILSTYVLSILSNRIFLINFDEPCKLEDFFKPNLYDWRFKDEILKNNSFQNYDLKDDKAMNIIHVLMTSKSVTSIEHYFKAPVSFVRMNWDLTKEFRVFPGIEKFAPWITSLHFADIYQGLLTYFFRPNEFLLEAVESIKRNASKPKTVCSHARIGRSSNNPHDNVVNDPKYVKVIWEFLRAVDKTKYNLFLATDSYDVQKEFNTIFKNNIVTTSSVQGNIMHIDLNREGDVRGGLVRTALDFLFLRSCDVLIVSKSGFSIMAAYWRQTPQKLYCWTPHTIVPCSRYTLDAFYPTPILSPTTNRAILKKTGLIQH